MPRSRGDQGMRRTNGDDFSFPVVEDVGAVAAVFRQAQFFASDEVDGDVMFEHREVGMSADDAGQRFLHRQAGGIGDVDHPAHAVTAFARQVIAGVAARELDPLFDEPFDGPPAVFDDEARRLRIVEVRARNEGIADVILKGILTVQDGGDSTLRPGGGALFQAAFADQPDLAGLCETDGRRLSGQAAANDENVEIKRHVQIPLSEKAQKI